MPHSVLTGRAVRPGEPLWTQADTDLAVALLELEAGTCDGCGLPREDSMSADLEFGWVAEPVRCHACATRDRKARSWGENADASGIRWVVKRKD